MIIQLIVWKTHCVHVILIIAMPNIEGRGCHKNPLLIKEKELLYLLWTLCKQQWLSNMYLNTAGGASWLCRQVNPPHTIIYLQITTVNHH